MSLRSIVRALNHLHKMGLVHAELHPENLVLVKRKHGLSGECKLFQRRWHAIGDELKYRGGMGLYPFYNHEVAKLSIADDLRAFCMLYLMTRYAEMDKIDTWRFEILRCYM